MAIKKIISGGQTGADQAGLHVAIKHGIPHGGAIPKGRLTENPYKRIARHNRRATEDYKKQNVSFDKTESHNFSGITCVKRSGQGGRIDLACEGKYRLLKNDQSLFQSSHIDRNITLFMEDNKLTLCPPVYSDQ